MTNSNHGCTSQSISIAKFGLPTPASGVTVPLSLSERLLDNVIQALFESRSESLDRVLVKASNFNLSILGPFSADVTQVVSLWSRLKEVLSH